MAKWKRSTVGSILKGKLQEDGTTSPDYLKLKGGKYAAPLLAALKETGDDGGVVLKLESKKAQLQGIDEAVKAERMSEKTAEEVRTRIEKIPDYVRFELVLLQKEEK